MTHVFITGATTTIRHISSGAYDLFVNRIGSCITTTVKTAFKAIADLFTRLKEIISPKKLDSDSPKELDSDDPRLCMICLDGFKPMTEKNAQFLSCAHRMHEKCITRWFNTQKTANRPNICPICRTGT